jgi:hypothetical protein
MSEWIWVAAVGAAFGAGEWWGRRRTIRWVAQLLVEDVLRWGPGWPVPVVRLGKGGDE